MEDEDQEWFGSAPNMTSFTSKFIPKEMGDEVFNEIKRTRAHFMYCPPKNHKAKPDQEFVHNFDHKPKYIYSGGNLSQGNQITIFKANEWDNYIYDNNLDIYQQKCKLEKLTLDSLNILQQTQWEINLDFLREIAMFKGEMEEQQQIPFKKSTINSTELHFLPWIEDEIKNQIRIDNKHKIKSNQSKKNMWQFILNDASKAIRNTGNVFWHAWAVDTRTRLYPVNPSLSPAGDDFSKAMIRFKKWKPLTLEGFKWFKIHLYNLLKDTEIIEGKKTPKSFEDREKWVDKNELKLLEIAKNPKKFKRELGFEDKIFSKNEVFSRLAILIEYRRISLELKKLIKQGNRMSVALENIKSGMPIYLDASNNGFQHMAAFIKNKPLAEKVNLVETNLPNDLYQTISDKCREKIFEETNVKKLKKLGFNTDEEIEKLSEIFSRGFIKTPTMVKSYGGDVKEAIIGKPNIKNKKGIKKPSKGYYFDIPNFKEKDPKELKDHKKNTVHKLSPFYKYIKKLIEEQQDELPLINNFYLEYDTSKKVSRRWHIEKFEDFEIRKEKLEKMYQLSNIISHITKKSIEDITEDVNTKIKKVFNKIKAHNCKKEHPLKTHKKWLTHNSNYGINKPYIEWQALSGRSSIIRNIYAYFSTTSVELGAGFFSLQIPIDIKEDQDKSKWEYKTTAINTFFGMKNKKKRNKTIVYYLEQMIDLIFSSSIKTDLKDELIKGLKKEINLYSSEENKNDINTQNEKWTSKGCRERRKWRTKMITEISTNYLQKGNLNKNTEEIMKFVLFLFIGNIKTTIRSPLKNTDKKYKISKILNPGYDHSKNNSSLIPNIIHSFDATHMQLIINKFYKKGEREDFWAVHDCFGSHACDIVDLRKIIKNTFIELYKDLDLSTFMKQVLENSNNEFGEVIQGKNKKEIIESAEQNLGQAEKEEHLDIVLVKKARYMIG